MEQLERLTQGAFGDLHRADGTSLRKEQVEGVGRITTIVVPNPEINAASVIDGLAQRDSPLIPPRANAYVISDFNGDTQHIRKDDAGQERMYATYAVQFYWV